MAENVVSIRVRADDDTKAGLEKAKAAFRNYGDRIGKLFAKSVADGAESAEGEMARAGEEVSEALNEGFRKNMTRRMGELRSKFSLFGADLVDDTADGAEGESGSFRSRISGMFEKLGPVIKKVAIGWGGVLAAGVAMVALPAIGAAVNAGIVLGVGMGALKAGITGALQDKSVKKAWEGLAKDGQDALGKLGKGFREPMKDAAKTFSQLLENIGPSLESIGKSLGMAFNEIAPAVAAMVENLMPGLERAAEEAGPMIRDIADALPGIGRSLGRFFEDTANSSAGGQKLFRDMLRALPGLIDKTDDFLSKLSDLFEAIKSDESFQELTKALKDFREEVEESEKTTEGFRKGAGLLFRTSMNNWTMTVKALTQVVRGVEFLAGEFQRLWGKARPYINRVKDKLEELWDKVSSVKSRMHGSWSGMFSGLLKALAPVYSAIRVVRSLAASIDALRGRASGLSKIGATIGSARDAAGMATGGVVGGGGFRLVGEYGPELVRLPYGASVISNADSQRMMSATSAQSGPTVIEFSGATGRVESMLVEILRTAIRVRGGNVQTVLGA
jgi:phage-related protein